MKREALEQLGKTENRKIPVAYKLKYALVSILIYAVGVLLTYISLCRNLRELVITNPVLYFVLCLVLCVGTVLQCIGIVRVLFFYIKKVEK